MSLFFSDIAKLGPIQVKGLFVSHVFGHLCHLIFPFLSKNLILVSCRMYSIFSSGASHAVYAIFMHHTAMANAGCKIGLLCGAGTRMASYFYAMHRQLCLRQALLASIHCAEFKDLKKLPKNANHCISDIINPNFWRANYILLCCVFSAIRCLRVSCSQKPAMDKKDQPVHCTTKSIDKSIKVLNDPELFGPLNLEHVPDDLADESAQVFGDEAEE